MNLKNFFKMHGLGNDFVIFPWNDNIPTKSFIKRISSRKQGVGCDLVVFLKTLEGNIADYKALFSTQMARKLKFVEMHCDVLEK